MRHNKTYESPTPKNNLYEFERKPKCKSVQSIFSLRLNIPIVMQRNIDHKENSTHFGFFSYTYQHYL